MVGLKRILALFTVLILVPACGGGSGSGGGTATPPSPGGTPSVTWVIPPPSTATSGTSIMVMWNVNPDGQGPTGHTNVHYKTSSPPFTLGSSTSIQSGSGNFSATITVPTVTTPTIYYFGAHASIAGTGYETTIISVLVYPPGGGPPIWSVSITTASPPDASTIDPFNATLAFTVDYTSLDSTTGLTLELVLETQTSRIGILDSVAIAPNTSSTVGMFFTGDLIGAVAPDPISSPISLFVHICRIDPLDPASCFIEAESNRVTYN